MNVLFYISAGAAVISAIMVVTRGSAMHALVNLVVSFVALACVFWTLGAPFAAALQIVVYAGAILVLFLFAVMILNIGQEQETLRHEARGRLVWVVPVLLAAVLLIEFLLALAGGARAPAGAVIGPAPVGRNLYTTYAVGIEIASIMLLAGLAAAFHVGIIPGRLGERDE